MVNIYFSDFFQVSRARLEEYGAFNVSLINDLPVFIDPFLLFNSDNPTYQKLHEDIITYVRFLRDKAVLGKVDDGLLHAWFTFREVKQNWLGFSRVGNRGSGLGMRFARSARANLGSVFSDFGQEQVTESSHLEKLCLIADGVGRDNISDFTMHLIKEYLLNYTQDFARKHLAKKYRRVVTVDKVRFNYKTETWENDCFQLPFLFGDFVLLTPKDMLTRDDIWISKDDLYNDFYEIAVAVPDAQLRAQINNYFAKILPPSPKADERREAVTRVIVEYPIVLEYYIRLKEENKEQATSISSERVSATEDLFIHHVTEFVKQRLEGTAFYDLPSDTLEEARARLMFFKDFIENKDGYRLFYDGAYPVKREIDLQLLFRLTWFASPSDVNREVNNGRGPVDYTVSRGSKNKSLVEFKLAKNTHLRRNLENQVAIYKKANNTPKALTALLYFSAKELKDVNTILAELNLASDPDIILIDARDDNKPSASKAT